ncbi:alpha/beta hydrolase [Vibrio porteresiae]|uniref:Alpha/beta hydrolase-fold protein n=1 Tax=Vibrio porteresiae DSM 19223 TaxID=1123496 RepID=A0ABZ0QK47_9VIBR|nr:alpha/beta hydrolase-fold protein [Vibrio porteresiae]WPC75796.1 alpha/beta hydrolase-fold protein [Vibrio porteresiae DSM 19223]
MLKATRIHEGKMQQIYHFEGQAGHYYRGQLQSDVPLQSANISLGKETAKPLLQPGQDAADIYWYPQENGSAKFVVTTMLGQPKANVSITLQEIALKDDQRVSPKHDIQSPILLDTITAISSGDKQAITRFWQTVTQKGTPLIEPLKENRSLLTFLWRGADENNVGLLGAPYEGHAYLTHLKGTDIWYKSYVVSNTTRLSYRLAPNVPQLSSQQGIEQHRSIIATTQTDPLNRTSTYHEQVDPWGDASTVVLNQADLADETLPQTEVSVGHVKRHQLESPSLEQTRVIDLYHPAQDASLNENSPVLFLFDGSDYQDKIPVPTILDNLIAQGKIPPMRAVFIHHGSMNQRMKELPPNQAFTQFVAKELVPWLCEQQICPAAQDRILAGSSFGGLAALSIAHDHPDLFGKVLSQSGSFWWGPNHQSLDWLSQKIAQQPNPKIKIYLDAGVFETNPPPRSILHANQRLYTLLQEKGYNVAFKTLPGGHDFFSWRAAFAHGLTHLVSHSQYQ